MLLITEVNKALRGHAGSEKRQEKTLKISPFYTKDQADLSGCAILI